MEMENQGRTAKPSLRGSEKAEEEDGLTLHVPLGMKSLAGACTHWALKAPTSLLSLGSTSHPSCSDELLSLLKTQLTPPVGTAFSAVPGSKNHSFLYAATTMGFLRMGANCGLQG